MLQCVPKYFKFRLNGFLSCNQIIDGEVISNQIVKTSFFNGYNWIIKEVDYQEAIENIEVGYWTLL